VVIAPLTPEHATAGFDCGDPARNAWLTTRALGNQAQDHTRTYAALEGNIVRGFYALTTTAILRETLPGKLRRNAPEMVSGVLLAQLAVDKPVQGQGLSKELVLHAMGVAVTIAGLAGTHLLAVHPATPGLKSYYEKFGFSPVAAAPGPLMIMPMALVRKILALTA
jgi:GNAT superfamily N-acetyltransferase